MNLDQARLRERLGEFWIDGVGGWVAAADRGAPALSTAPFLTARWELSEVPDPPVGWIDPMLARPTKHSPRHLCHDPFSVGTAYVRSGVSVRSSNDPRCTRKGA